jgi:branched-chain amino acid transport system permease protein
MFLGGAGYATGYAIQTLGFTPELAACSPARGGRAAGARRRPARDPPPGHLFRDDHAGARADGLLHLPAGAVHGGEDGLQACRAATCSACSTCRTTSRCTTSCSRDRRRVAFIVRVVHSPFGQVLVAIKENEPRAISLGYDTDRFKLLAFILSAGLAGWPAR